MDHSTPGAQAGAAWITLGRYTHVLDGELERARDQLDAFLVEREGAQKKAAPGWQDAVPYRWLAHHRWAAPAPAG